VTGHPALDIDSVSKGFGAVDILRQVSVRVERAAGTREQLQRPPLTTRHRS
jgi:ABC-type branched-subunit amino acid transport system ATPase component